MRRLLAALALFVIPALFVNSAIAETVPAVSSNKWIDTGNNVTGKYDDMTTACAAAKLKGEQQWPDDTVTVTLIPPSTCQRKMMLKGGDYTFYSSLVFTQQAFPSCADSTWTLSANGLTCSRPDCRADQIRDANGACTCPAGKNEVNGVCTSCPNAGSNAMIGGAVAWKITGTSGGCMAGFGFGGCRIACLSGVSANGQAACTGCTFTGNPSSAGDPTAQPTADAEKKNPTTPDGCLAQGKGYIQTSSGVTCVAATDSPTPVEKSSKENITTNGPNGPSSSEKQTTTECGGGTCKETITETGPNGTNTQEKKGPQDNFCEQNPNSPMCKDKEDPCDKEGADRLSCAKFGDADAPGDIESKLVTGSLITPISFGGAASCPADIPLPKGSSLSFKWSCDMATTLRPLLLALAWLAAGLIVVGAFRE